MAELNAEFTAAGKKKFAQEDLDKMVHEATLLASVNLLTLTLVSGGNPNGVQQPNVVPPLCTAIQKASPAMVQALIDFGADVNKPVFHDTTPLMLCLAHGQHALMDKLIAAGADLNAKDDRGRTVLMLAATDCDAIAFRKFLEAGADLTLADKKGRVVKDIVAKELESLKEDPEIQGMMTLIEERLSQKPSSKTARPATGLKA
jgi:ankyrin repeat protein